MPETYGLPEPEPTKAEQAKAAINEVIAGQGITRRVMLYAIAMTLVVSSWAPLAVVPVVLLMATDRGLE